MKRRILTTLLLAVLSLAVFAQKEPKTACYGQISTNAVYDQYIAKSGDTISVGDTLIIGRHTGNDHFLHIQQGVSFASPWIAGKEVAIKKIKSYGKNKKSRILWMQFDGSGLVPVSIDYENAIATKEVINPNLALTKDEAIAQLKAAKEQLDLELISQDEYDKLKNKLSPVILK